jgi:DNA-binding Lrp family transcriptional regulator
MKPTACSSNLEAVSFQLSFFSVRRTISNATWAEIRTAYASGIGLREIARNLNIPEGTVLARAKREGWTREIKNARALAKRENSALAITPVEAVAATLAERGQRHLKRIAGVSKRGVDHIETMDGPEILNSVDQIEKLDKVARRTFGLNDNPYSGFTLNVLNINSIQLDQDSPETR